MEENLASATADSVSASALWSQEKEFWDSKVDTNSGPRTREAQHFRLVHWASSLLKERDEVRAQLALSPPAEESIIIRQELDLLETQIAEKGVEKMLQDLSRRWSERETRERNALQVHILLRVSCSHNKIYCLLQAEQRVKVCPSSFFWLGYLIVLIFPKEIGNNVKSYREKASHLIAAQKYVAFGWSADPVASAFIGL